MYKDCVQTVDTTWYKPVQKAVDVIPAFTQQASRCGDPASIVNSLVNYALNQTTCIYSTFTQGFASQQQITVAGFTHYTQALLLPLLRYNKEYNIERGTA